MPASSVCLCVEDTCAHPLAGSAAVDWLDKPRLNQLDEPRGLIDVNCVSRVGYDRKVRMGQERLHAGANLSVARVKLADDQLHRLLDFWQARPQGGLLAGAHAAQAHR